MFLSFRFDRLFISALLLVVAARAAALEPLSLAQAQRIAEDQSQQLLAQTALIRSSREQAIAAGQLPDPILKLGVDNLPANGPDRFSLTRDFMTMRRIGLSQEIPRPEKRQLKAEKFERDAQRSEAQRLLMLANVQRDTALAWLDRYYAGAQRELLQKQIVETRLQVQGAQSAFGTGRASQADVFAARAAAILLQDRLSEIERQSRSAALMLARWVGSSNAERPLSGAPPWQSAPIETALLEQHLENHPDLLAARAEIDAAQSQLRLAEANTKSDISVEASYAQRGPAFSNMLSFGVSIPLQWDQKNRQDREVGARLARVEETRARYEDMLRAHEAEVRSWLNDWQTGKQRLNRYRDELIPNAHQRSEAALTGYRAGKADLASALAARRDEIDTQIQVLTLENETARSWARLAYLNPQRENMAALKEKP